jgi:hypothetical protein
VCVRRFDAVLCWKFDRFARSVSHLLRALEAFRSMDIEFVSFSEQMDTSTPTGKMVFTVLGAVGEPGTQPDRRTRAGRASTCTSQWNKGREWFWTSPKLTVCGHRGSLGAKLTKKWESVRGPLSGRSATCANKYDSRSNSPFSLSPRNPVHYRRKHGYWETATCLT